MGYWLLSLAVLLLGFLTGFSIGAFILPVGIALVVLGPVRRRPRVYWPALMAVVGFVVGYLLFVPLTCTATAAVPGGDGATACQSILGPEYRSAGVGEPPTDLARLAGAVGAVAGGLLAFGAQVAAGRRDLAGPSEPTQRT
jgi:energy-coupling factor transporter transmembrane protein EcfT